LDREIDVSCHLLEVIDGPRVGMPQYATCDAFAWYSSSRS